MRHITLLLIGLQGLGAVIANTAGQASNFDIPPDVAVKYGCDKSCQKKVEEANIADLKIWGTNFDFDFYATASNFSASKPGDILKIKPVSYTEIAVPPGVAVYKIQYTSIDLDGTPVPSTGFIAFPFARMGKSFKLVAYAHGTSGVFPGCAPSTSPNLYDYYSWTQLLLAGYAVVATDYAGIGNNHTAHKYIASAANSNDIYWSVAAARNAFPDILSHEWASIGHSQGGGAVWKLSEHRLVQDSKSGYLGGVSVAPVSKLYDALLQLDQIRGLAASFPPDLDTHFFLGLGVLPSAMLGVTATFPNYTAPIISERLKQRIELAKIGQMCDTAISGLAVDLRLDAISSCTVESDKILREYQRINAPAQGDLASKPLLLILGEEDTIVSKESDEASYAASCGYGNAIHMSVYPGLDHSAVLGAAAPEYLVFLQDLFTNTYFKNCSMETKTPFDLNHASRPMDDH
jgi:pimeloyl-ACP methyl ester carboxylesterase